jgi:hypothetical protein
MASQTSLLMNTRRLERKFRFSSSQSDPPLICAIDSTRRSPPGSWRCTPLACIPSLTSRPFCHNFQAIVTHLDLSAQTSFATSRSSQEAACPPRTPTFAPTGSFSANAKFCTPTPSSLASRSFSLDPRSLPSDRNLRPHLHLLHQRAMNASPSCALCSISNNRRLPPASASTRTR